MVLSFKLWRYMIIFIFVTLFLTLSSKEKLPSHISARTDSFMLMFYAPLTIQILTYAPKLDAMVVLRKQWKEIVFSCKLDFYGSTILYQ